MANKARQYLETQVMTAPKERLLLMLFDGAIKFAEQAGSKMSQKDIEGTHNLLIRAQRIVLELLSALDKAIGEELYKNLTGLYLFIYDRLVMANLQQSPAPLDEALRILRMLRETWAEAIERSQKGSADKKEGGSPAGAKEGEPIKLSVVG